MVITDIFSKCKEILAEPENIYLQAAREEGKKVIAYTCGYVPEAMLSVEGLVGYKATAIGGMGTEMADTYLSNVSCSYSRSLLEDVLDFKMQHIDGWVSAASCDHIRRFYDNLLYLEKPDFAHILDVPNKSGEAAIDWYEEELHIFAQKLSQYFAVDTGKQSLNQAIANRNKTFAIIRTIGDLRKKSEPVISGTEFMTLVKASSLIPYADFEELCTEIIEQLASRKLDKNYRARVMLFGSELDEPEYINAIEKSGALVVADRFGNGSIPGAFVIVENDENPIRALAENKLKNIPSPRMMDDFESRIDLILKTAKDYQVDGIIFETMKFCDLWCTESGPLVTRIRAADIPVLRLEREYRISGEGQLNTRVQAFLESMGK